MAVQRLRLWQGKIETEVEIAGSGSPLVYLHGPWGLPTDRPFLDLLATRHTIYAPRHPGTTPGDPDAIHQIDDWWDLMVYYGELLDRLGVGQVAVIGHSFGGLVACEMAASMPARVRRVALIDPVGLWRDDLPVRNWMILSEEERRRALFADPAGAAAQKFFTLPSDTEARVEAQAAFVWAQACTGKFVWPIPDKGLKKRIHRISMPTLIMWGRADGVIAPAYAQEFCRCIAGSRVELIGGAGHSPHLEQPERVAKLIGDFLDG